MRKIFLLYILVFCIFLSGCISMYPLKNKLRKVEQLPDISQKIKLTNKDFFQLRIFEYRVFIEELNQTSALASDFPYRKFEQASVRQDSIEQNDFINKSFVEETYLYLDNISKADSVYRGIAIYFITYPMINDYRKEVYFQNPEYLYTCAVRKIQVGYWIKNENGDIVLVFKVSKKKIIVMKGNYHNNIIGIKKVSHSSYEIKEKRDSVSFQEIDKQAAYIDLNNVLDISKCEELRFINIPDNKIFTHRKHDKRVEKIKILNKRLKKRGISFELFPNMKNENIGIVKELLIDGNKKKLYFKVLDNELNNMVNYCFKKRGESLYLVFDKDMNRTNN